MLGESAVPATSALARHLAGGFPRPGESFFRRVANVEPGQALCVGSQDVRARRYWQLAALPPPNGDAAAALDSTLLAVVGQTVDPAAFALTLSGGLDSPALADALCRLHPAANVRALTWVSPGIPVADERSRAEAVAERLGLRQEQLEADDHWPLSGGLATEFETPYRLHFAELWKVPTSGRASKGSQAWSPGRAVTICSDTGEPGHSPTRTCC